MRFGSTHESDGDRATSLPTCFLKVMIVRLSRVLVSAVAGALLVACTSEAPGIGQSTPASLSASISKNTPATDISGVPPGFTPQALRAVSPRAAGATQAAEASGAPTFLATTQGVVWSFNIENGSGVVLRSTDDGNHWRVVLSEPTSQVSFGLVAGYFLGSDDAWAALEEQTGATSVYRTSDGGRHWYLSDLPIVAPPPNMTIFVSDQFYFADPEHGWLLAVGNDLVPGLTNSLTMLWWRTDNGGRTWSQLPPTGLPPQAVALPPNAGTACPVFSPPHIAFATADIGWWTYGACGRGAARPLVWHTSDGGRNWTPTPLPAPPGGWGRWDVLDQGGTDVGSPYLIPSGTGTTLVVPVSVGTSKLVIERSLDMGRSWRIAGMVDTHALPIQSTPADWFDPVSTSDWAVAAPGGLIETTNFRKNLDAHSLGDRRVRPTCFVHLSRRRLPPGHRPRHRLAHERRRPYVEPGVGLHLAVLSRRPGRRRATPSRRFRSSVRAWRSPRARSGS